MTEGRMLGLWQALGSPLLPLVASWMAAGAVGSQLPWWPAAMQMHRKFPAGFLHPEATLSSMQLKQGQSTSAWCGLKCGPYS